MDGLLPQFITREALALSDADLTPNGKIRSMERAKANHLLRQLQLRLQYARLKVDHGWQKQRLNEVENLYFRQQKQSDVSVKPTYPATALLSTPIDPLILAQQQPDDAGPNSSLSFKSHVHHPQPDAQEGLDGISMVPPAPYEHPNGSSQWQFDMSSHIPPEAGPSTQTPPPPRHDPNQWLQQRPHDATPAPIATAATPFLQGSPSSAALASFATTQSPSPSRNQSSFAPSTASASLTYDSFWSSHDNGQASAPVPAPTFAPAPMFSPRNGKGKGRVAAGPIVKRKSPVTRIGGPG
ncbi:hypothetical protein B0H13DRAFT_1998495 [Mycena leptocephala]|nr:hypothetical protein B0H13DRAFT_1998495 [Mycena leptocephala]